ncbi:hypothetical protein [Clostridium brassicae]|uniref:Prepilin-type N-terminal cleavage/methylation domain-containing protein n=1 Tax=Clostridium brassicae TaxID=2999072 RepID=A0ABT4DHH7_9CLOT|nr:hypothetical protein [Clostridium brassicae]MCY6960469.1 hypothetical protein [Clostridium brassicae]
MLRLKSNTRKGIGVIEVLCSMAILLILCNFTFSTKMHVLKLNQYNKKSNQYVEFLASLKENMYFNYSCEEIQNLRNSKMIMINKENINSQSIKDKGINIFEKEVSREKPYLLMNIKDDNEVLKIELILYVDINNKSRTLKSICFKGEY